MNKKRKTPPFKKAYVGFPKKFAAMIKPVKAEIMASVKRGDAPAHAVKTAMLKHDVHRKVLNIMMDSIVESAKSAGIRFK